MSFFQFQRLVYTSGELIPWYMRFGGVFLVYLMTGASLTWHDCLSPQLWRFEKQNLPEWPALSRDRSPSRLPRIDFFDEFGHKVLPWLFLEVSIFFNNVLPASCDEVQTRWLESIVRPVGRNYFCNLWGGVAVNAEFILFACDAIPMVLWVVWQ